MRGCFDDISITSLYTKCKRFFCNFSNNFCCIILRRVRMRQIRAKATSHDPCGHKRSDVSTCWSRCTLGCDGVQTSTPRRRGEVDGALSRGYLLEVGAEHNYPITISRTITTNSQFMSEGNTG